MLWWFGDRAFEFAIRRLCTLHESQSGVRWTRRRGRPSQRVKDSLAYTSHTSANVNLLTSSGVVMQKTESIISKKTK